MVETAAIVIFGKQLSLFIIMEDRLGLSIEDIQTLTYSFRLVIIAMLKLPTAAVTDPFLLRRKGSQRLGCPTV